MLLDPKTNIDRTEFPLVELAVLASMPREAVMD